MIEPLAIIILAGALGGLVRCILGFLGEREPGEPFSFKKFAKTLARAVIGGAILAYWLEIDFKGAFFAAFRADVATKNVWDIIKKKE